MPRILTGNDYVALDEERIALRIRIALLEERGGDRTEIEQARERMGVLRLQIEKIVAGRPAPATGRPRRVSGP